MSAPAERSAKLDNYSSDLHKWQCVHSEYNLEVHRHNITQLSEDTTLPTDIDTHVFSKYANIYFKHPYRCLDKGIDQPFLSKQNPKDSQDAVNLFAMVLAYMNDGQLSAKNEHLQANYIVQHCLENQALTDEFYCQIVNQTWQNKDRLALHRGWKLMCTALSAIPPSPPISNYLLKYVSDHGYNGYKNVCQHKLLECKELTPDRARNYPPTLLEWNCAEKQSGMALQARLSDGQNATAAVQSWTTGDEYTANLLQSRHVDSGCFGWTVMLQDNNVQYELSGDDYVLDLISEIEHPPGAPYCTRPFIVSHDKPEGSNSKPFQDSPHDPELDKVSLWNIAEMHQPVPVSPRPAPAMAPRSPAMPSQAAPVPSTSTQPQPPVLSNSVLNKRQTIHDPSLAQDSMLNIRYVQHSGAGSASPSNNAQQPRPVTIPAPPIDHNGTDFPEYNDDFELSNNRLNQRYNGSAEPSIDGARPPVKQPTPDQRYSNAWENRGSVKSKSSDPSNLEDWVDNMFNDALGSGFDDFSDARTLSNRLKGGGQGLPGVAQPPPPPAPPLLNGLPPGNLVTSGNPLGNGTLPSSVPPVNYVHAAPQPPTINPTYTGPMQGAIPLGAFPVMPDPTTQILLQAQQMAQQQAAVQQVAAQQAAAQQYAAQAQQAQQTKQQQAQQVSQQAHTRLQQELDKQTLTNQLLEQTVQGEILKKQLEQLQGAPKPSANVRFTPGPPAGQPSGGRGPSPPVRRKPTKQNGYIGAGGQRIPGEIDESRPGGVRTLKHNFEKHMHSALDPGMFQQAPADYSHPSTYIDDVLNAPQRSTDGIPPPGSVDMVQPPPPPPMPDSQPGPHVDASANEPVTKVAVAGKLGGKIQWPPKKDESHKKDVHVGRLMIDEKKKEDRPPLEGMPHTMKLIKDASTTGDHPTPRKTVGKLPLGTPAPPPPPPPPMDTSKIATPVDVKHGDKDQASVSIDMASRKNALAQQLSKVGMLKGGNKPTTHDIQQKSQPMKSPAMVNSSPVTKYQAPPPPPPIPNDISALHDTPRPLMPTSIVKRSTDISPAESIADISTVDTKALENVHTVLHDNVKAPYVAYQHVPWKLHVRKELFTPTETIDNQSVIDLIFCQIVADVFSASMRIEKQDRMRMLSIMQNNGITPNSMLNKHKPQVKKMILDTAMEWPFYFSRLFHVQGGTKQPKLNMVAVGHSGVRLLTVEKDLFANTLQVMEHFKYEDIVDYSVPKPDTFQLHVGNRYIIIYTPKAYQLRDLIEAFCIECEKDVMYGRAVKSYRTREQTLLSFVEGDLIKVARNADTSTGWLYGSLRGKAGLFPSEYIKPLARHELPQKQPERPKPTALPISPGPQTNGHTNGYHEDGDGISIPSAYDTLPPPTGKFSMMEFAMLYFRKSPYRYEMKRGADTGSIHGSIKMISSLKAKSIALQQQKKHSSGNWSWSEEVDMVKWSKSPIQASLLNLNPELNKISLECFFAIMQYMGDYPLNKGQKPSDCVYTIITACHNHFQIVDEVYCQLAKQTTSNRSVKPESLQQGWRMLAIMTAYYNCTDVLRPYLFKYLEQMAYDNQKRQHQAIAALSLHNLRTTIRFGGRKNVPSRIEVEAMTRGRNSKRQTCILPGGIPTVLNVRSSNVVLDCLTQICSRLQITDEMEREEMTIFYVIQSENRYCPLKRGEYMFDITTELMNQKKTFYLLFQRTSWVMPLVFTRNQLYIDVMFHQCIPDYLDGFMLPLSTALPSYIKEELSMLAALQFKAAEVPGQTQKERRELITYIPRNAMAASDALSWVQLITDAIKSLHNRSPHQCKVQFLEILSRWPLFGSTFFTIKSVSDQRIRGECLLAINKHGVHMLNNKTHETELKYKFDEIISTRRLQADNRTHYLEMKCGDLMRQKITRLETDQGSDISRLIAQYILILSKTTKHRPR